MIIRKGAQVMKIKYLIISLTFLFFLTQVMGLDSEGRVPLVFEKQMEGWVFTRDVYIGTLDIGYRVEATLTDDLDEFNLKMDLLSEEREGSVYMRSNVAFWSDEVPPGETFNYTFDNSMKYVESAILVIEAIPREPDLKIPDDLSVRLNVTVYDEDDNVILTMEDAELGYGERPRGSDSPSFGPLMILSALMMIGIGTILFGKRRRLSNY